MYPYIWLFSAVLTAIVASNNRRSTCSWLMLGLCFNVIALAWVAFLPQLKLPQAAARDDALRFDRRNVRYARPRY